MHKTQTKHKTQNTEHKPDRVWVLGFRKFVLCFGFVSLCFVFFIGEANAGAVFNKPPVTLGLISGLVGYWSFDGQDTGTTSAVDLSGNSNTGRFINGPRKTAGKIGQALNFDGVNDYVNIPDISFADQVTLSAWYYTDNNSQIGIIFGEDSGNSSGGPKLGMSGGNFLTRFVSTAYTQPQVPASGQWHHVVWVRDSGGEATLYVDTQPTSGGLTGGGSGTFILDKIGVNGSDASQNFQGRIDEVRVYNRALSAEEIKRLYNMGR